MRLFLTQLGWEFYKAAARPRTWLPFAVALLLELVVSLALCHPLVRVAIARDLWKMRWSFDEAFSGLTTATHLLGEVAMVAGALGVALFAGEIVARECDDGTLRMILSRPGGRFRLLAQKLIVCVVYTIVLALFNGGSALAVGLLFEGRGPLIMVAPHEEVIGTFDYATGLERYRLAVALLTLSSFSGMVVALAFSCFNMRPAAAVALSLTIFIADTCIRTAPGFGAVRPWCATTRVLAWRQVFNQEIPSTRLRRDYTQLACWNAAWLGIGWLGFRRRDLKP